MNAIRQAIMDIAVDAPVEEQRALCRRAFDKVFSEDVERLLRMEDMWRNRRRPIPIRYDEASCEEEAAAGAENGAGPSSSTLRDQKVLSLKDTIALFDESLLALARRIAQRPDEPIAFDKDDVDTLNFVTATSNLRSRIYHIAPQTRFQVKEMAGNIIPAIASTNAIIAGAQVFQLLQALRHAWNDARFVSLNKMNSTRLMTSFACGKPNVECGVCQDDYIRAGLDVESTTLGQLKQAVIGAREDGGLGFTVEGLELFESSRLLADEDFDDNLQSTLQALGIREGMTITCVDEDGIRANLNVVVAPPTGKDIAFGAADKLPQLRNKVRVEKAEEESSDDDGVVELVDKPVEQSTKRKRAGEEGEASVAPAASKKTRMATKSGGDEGQAIELD